MNQINNPNASDPDSHRIVYGKRLYVAAWAVEIIAASIGLFLAGAQIIQGSEGLTGTDGTLSTGAWVTVVLGALPFLVVAIVELTKIPLATAAYIATERLNRILFITGLALVTFVTFETFLNGFEQNFTVRTAPVKKLQREIHSVEAEIQQLADTELRIQNLTLESIDQKYDDQKRSLATQLNETVSSIENQIVAKREESGGAKLPGLVLKIVDARTEIDRLQTERNSEAQRVTEEFDERISSQRNNATPRTEALNQQINQLTARLDQVEGRLEELNRERLNIQKTNSGSETLGTDFEALRANRIREAQAKVEDQRNQLTQALNRLEAKLAAERDRFESLGLFAGTQKKETQESIAKLQQQIVEQNNALNGLSMDAEIASIDREINQLRKKENEASSDRVNAQISLIDEQISSAEQQLSKVARELSLKRQELQNIVSDGQIAQFLAQKNNALNALRAEFDSKIASLRDQIARYEEEITLTESRIEDSVAPFEARKRAEITNAQENAEQQLKLLMSRQQAERDDFNNQKARLTALASQLDERRTALLDLRAKIEVVAAGSQIYRIAVMVYDDVETVSDVGPEHTKWISILWFGSLAAIIAVTGTLLAYASLVMRFGKRADEDDDQSFLSDIYRGAKAVITDIYVAVSSIWPAVVNILRFFKTQISKLFWSLRFLLVSLTKRIRSPKIVKVPVEITKEIQVEKIVEKEVEVIKEVIKEVPVDKVVMKEIPVEVVREKVIHVPIATDDLSILDIQYSSGRSNSSASGENKDD